MGVHYFGAKTFQVINVFKKKLRGKIYFNGSDTLFMLNLLKGIVHDPYFWAKTFQVFCVFKKMPCGINNFNGLDALFI